MTSNQLWAVGFSGFKDESFVSMCGPQASYCSFLLSDKELVITSGGCREQRERDRVSERERENDRDRDRRAETKTQKDTDRQQSPRGPW